MEIWKLPWASARAFSIYTEMVSMNRNGARRTVSLSMVVSRMSQMSKSGFSRIRRLRCWRWACACAVDKRCSTLPTLTVPSAR